MEQWKKRNLGLSKLLKIQSDKLWQDSLRPRECDRTGCNNAYLIASVQTVSVEPNEAKGESRDINQNAKQIGKTKSSLTD